MRSQGGACFLFDQHQIQRLVKLSARLTIIPFCRIIRHFYANHEGMIIRRALNAFHKGQHSQGGDPRA